MNGEIKLITGPLGLNTQEQDGVDKILNTPIINDGSNNNQIELKQKNRKRRTSHRSAVL